MNKKLIGKINGVEIVTVEQNGEVYVPIRPICVALGVSYQKQQEKLQHHPILASTVTLRVTVAADSKDREMVCILLEYVYGWLFTINASNVPDSAKETLVIYQKECYLVLYGHFAGGLRRQVETNEAEIALLREINAAIGDEKEAKSRRREAEDKLAKLRAERLNPQPVLF